MRTREVIGGCIFAIALSGCGYSVGSPDLFQLTRTGQGQQLTLVVSDGGTVRCNGSPPKALPGGSLLEARKLVRSLARDAQSKLRIPPNRTSVFSYTLRTQDGALSFPDTSAFGHPELAAAERFAVHTARDPCRLPG